MEPEDIQRGVVPMWLMLGCATWLALFGVVSFVRWLA